MMYRDMKLGIEIGGMERRQEQNGNATVVVYSFKKEIPGKFTLHLELLGATKDPEHALEINGWILRTHVTMTTDHVTGKNIAQEDTEYPDYAAALVDWGKAIELWCNEEYPHFTLVTAFIGQCDLVRSES